MKAARARFLLISESQVPQLLRIHILQDPGNDQAGGDRTVPLVIGLYHLGQGLENPVVDVGLGKSLPEPSGDVAQGWHLVLAVIFSGQLQRKRGLDFGNDG
jgi:hypothetical protein